MVWKEAALYCGEIIGHSVTHFIKRIYIPRLNMILCMPCVCTQTEICVDVGCSPEMVASLLETLDNPGPLPPPSNRALPTAPGGPSEPSGKSGSTQNEPNPPKKKAKAKMAKQARFCSIRLMSAKPLDLSHSGLGPRAEGCG